ncbi:hypothetical protein KCG44_09185 [Pacificimonas sp. WHA3]|uniref:Uncharacterized protein n=1 Tax=Pacificimonas pallii TaxID=2827236 RepID=A0ABS6SEY3_9SPHN|nr:hypothetical protein [Pacificimonas pallii]MBV7256954.1 hypothetical protein [Pacificimonas pallii]
MAVEIGAAALTLTEMAGPAAAGTPSAMPTAASLTDIGNFGAALERASQAGGKDMVSPAMESVMETMSKVDGEARDLAVEANRLAASGKELTPSEMIDLTVRSHQFMFHCQLTSNIANRTSDGLSQLFRQQA